MSFILMAIWLNSVQVVTSAIWDFSYMYISTIDFQISIFQREFDWMTSRILVFFWYFHLKVLGKSVGG